MAHYKTLFHQLLQLVPRHHFDTIVIPIMLFNYPLSFPDLIGKSIISKEYYFLFLYLNVQLFSVIGISSLCGNRYVKYFSCWNPMLSGENLSPKTMLKFLDFKIQNFR